MRPINVSDLGEPRQLFHNQNFSDFLHGRVRDLSLDVERYPSEQLLNTPTEDLVAALIEKRAIDVPALRKDEAYVDGPHEVQWRRMDFDHEIVVKGTLVALVVPLNGEAGLLYANPNRYGGSIRANLYYNNVVFTVRGEQLHAPQVDKTLQDQMSEVEQMLVLMKDMHDRDIELLPSRVRREIEARKLRLLSDKHMVAGLSFPLRSRLDVPKTYVAPVQRKKIIATAPALTKPFAPEPVLDETNYVAILEIIESMTLVMERSPTAFAKMSEEDLRQHYLVQLNGHFEGAATGETFNFQGKTDILIRVKDRNIFIAECKFWGGPKGHHETIDQLLRYLTWRDTKAAIISFNRNKNFGEMLKSLADATTSHPNWKRGPSLEGESRARYVFSNPMDANREFVLTTLAFDIPAYTNNLPQ